ncbi:MAG: iron complex transport system substrate-binding protein [Candidatus Kentron sp. G]|nr:MAG: iron complex transport system substrate-binding protein [Candidatus Kentron sp. G]VFN00169.1 MAG: iron complex transport system substrate-binding protein [Candidatus Kentron sp. G]VFN01812.1 MAG: iron complex transport system substrate-binding protein [Candidatus Kentron sp. G]
MTNIGALLFILALGLLIPALILYPPNPQFAVGGALEDTRVIGEDFPKRLIDPLGDRHWLTKPPRRIASANLASDEILTELVSLERLVSVSYLVDDPGISNAAGHYPKAIPRNHGRIEELVAASPDLVILSPHSDALTVRRLLRMGVPVARFTTLGGLAGVRENIRTLGAIVGEKARAEALIERIYSRVANIGDRIIGQPPPRVLFYNLNGSTGGPNSLTDEMIGLAGGYNVIRDTAITGYRRITPELAIALQPEILILDDWFGSGHSARELLGADPAWQQVPAIRNRQIHPLRGAWVTTGSQYCVAGIEAIAKILHPGRFGITGRL